MFHSSRIVKRSTPRFIATPQREIWHFLVIGGAVLYGAATLGQTVLRLRSEWKEAKGKEEPKVKESPVEQPKTNNNQDVVRERVKPRPKPNPIQTKTPLTAAFGLDFGSSSAKLCYRNQNSFQILENKEGKRSIPTSVHITHDEDVVGQLARSVRWLKPRQTLASVPLLLGANFSSDKIQEFLKAFDIQSGQIVDNEFVLTLNDTMHPIGKLNHMIIHDVLTSAGSKISQYKKVPIIAAIPHFLSEEQHTNFIAACRQAGLPCVGAVSDALCAYFGAKKLEILPNSASAGEKLLVVDVGGKFSQLTLMEIPAEGEIPRILHTATLLDVGVDRLDSMVVSYLANQFGKDNKVEHVLSDNMAKQRLYDAVEVAKIDLSKSPTTNVNIPFLTADASGPKHLNINLTRSIFEMISSPVLERFRQELKTFIGGTTEEIRPNHVVFVGGGARILKMRSEVQDITGVVPLVGHEPEEVVCVGAAAYSEFITS